MFFVFPLKRESSKIFHGNNAGTVYSNGSIVSQKWSYQNYEEKMRFSSVPHCFSRLSEDHCVSVCVWTGSLHMCIAEFPSYNSPKVVNKSLG